MFLFFVVRSLLQPAPSKLLPVLTAFLRWAGGRYCSDLECCSFSSEVNSFAFSTVVRNSVVLPVARNCFLVAKGMPARCSLAEESSPDMACSSSCFRSCRNTGCASPRTIFLCGNVTLQVLKLVDVIAASNSSFALAYLRKVPAMMRALHLLIALGALPPSSRCFIFFFWASHEPLVDAA